MSFPWQRNDERNEELALQQQPALEAQGSQPWHIPGPKILTGGNSPSPCAPAKPSGAHTLLVGG